LGVLEEDARSAGSRSSGTSLALHAGVSVSEWKYTNGLCRVAYWSVALALWSLSGAPDAGWRHVAGLAGVELPMSSM
jgi:hypothetical protein